MNTAAVNGVDLSSVLEHVRGFVLRNCDHRTLILGQVFVNEVNVCHFFTWRAHRGQIVAKSSCQKCYQRKVLPFWSFTIRFKEKLIDLFFGILSLSLNFGFLLILHNFFFCEFFLFVFLSFFVFFLVSCFLPFSGLLEELFEAFGSLLLVFIFFVLEKEDLIKSLF
jgi:hypothetical protein